MLFRPGSCKAPELSYSTSKSWPLDMLCVAAKNCTISLDLSAAATTDTTGVLSGVW